MQEYIMIDNGELILDHARSPDLWNGLFSIAKTNGAIVKYIHTILIELQKSCPKRIIFILPLCDGNVNLQKLGIGIPVDSILIIGTLGETNRETKTNKLFNAQLLFMPLDDHFFENGITGFFETIPWEERIPTAFWRGGCSGTLTDSLDTVRVRVVKECLGHSLCDIKLTHYWSDGKNIPEEYFSDRVEFQMFLKYKIFLIIDGNVIASNHMWGFASGAVPMIISNATCWFSDLLIPVVNFIPIKYDLSDLLEQIEWVINNDSKAKQIATEAAKFADTFFSSEYQKKYIMHFLEKSVKRLCI